MEFEKTELYRDCTLCPNLCHVDRTKGQLGRCGQTDKVFVAWSGLHKGEEPPISGEFGSGMIFFWGCPLHCRYCQNYQISGGFSSNNIKGTELSVEQLSELMLELQKARAASINFVTGTHFVPSIIEAIKIARSKGLSLKTVWNSSGYETADVLRMIDPYIDLYLLDIKTLDSTVASKFCGLEKYSSAILPVAKFIKSRIKTTDLDNLSGALIRHLVFPGTVNKTMEFLEWYADNLKDNTKLSLMTQFVPPLENPGFEKISDSEYEKLCDKLDELGIDGFIQEREDNEILWIPDFRRDQPFPDNFASPLEYFLEIKKLSTGQKK